MRAVLPTIHAAATTTHRDTYPAGVGGMCGRQGGREEKHNIQDNTTQHVHPHCITFQRHLVGEPDGSMYPVHPPEAVAVAVPPIIRRTGPEVNPKKVVV